MFRRPPRMPDGYLVDRDANFIGPRRKLLKNLEDNTCGYLRLTINYKQKLRKFLVHRMVAEAHIPNPENKKFVNHIDGDKHNNHADNLEWCTASENAKHAIENGLHKPNYEAMLEYNRVNGTWNKGKHTGNQYTRQKETESV